MKPIINKTREDNIAIQKYDDNTRQEHTKIRRTSSNKTNNATMQEENKTRRQ